MKWVDVALYTKICKVNNNDNRKTGGACSKLTINTKNDVVPVDLVL